jgi:hypothetical protein
MNTIKRLHYNGRDPPIYIGIRMIESLDHHCKMAFKNKLV